MLFSKPKRAIGIDIGTHSVKSVQMSRSGSRLRLEGAGYALIDRNQFNLDPVTAQAVAVRESLRSLVEAQSLIVVALPGQSVVIRYPRLANMPEDRLQEAIEKEAGQHIPYDLSEVFLDWTLLDTMGDEKLLKVLLLAAKHELIDARLQVTDAAEVKTSVLGVDALALADAAEACDNLRVGETVALINIGYTSVSIHFVKDGISNFIRDVSWGGRDLIQAISRARRCEMDEAERLLQAYGSEAALRADGPPEFTPPDESPPPEPSLPTSSLLDPFEDEPGIAGEPGKKAAKPAAAASNAKPLEEVMAGSLAKLVSEIRRSFDYYEHELYESPVNRLILSGGVTSIPFLPDTLSEELGIRDVEVANPAESALQLGDRRAVKAVTDRPAQFVVAVGLAARGAAVL